MESERREDLAPCVAVVGPPDSGKSTFCTELDGYLQHHQKAPLVQVVKANPDAVGHYMIHSPGVRAEHKEGKWDPVHTVTHVCFSLLNARRYLELVVADVGGRISPFSRAILRCCTHYIVVARRLPDDGEEREHGMEAWKAACQCEGLKPLAWLTSVLQTEVSGTNSELAGDDTQPVQGRYVRDYSRAAASPNDAVVKAVGDRMIGIRLQRPRPPYFDLRLPHDWEIADLCNLGGRKEDLRSHVTTHKDVLLGGRAPIWAYLAGMHMALDVRPEAGIRVFDPKLPGGQVPIPDEIQQQGEHIWNTVLQVTWSQEDQKLELQICTQDKFLPPALALLLDKVPLPKDPPGDRARVSGAVPVWLHLTYSRWLRARRSKEIFVWDARLQQDVKVWPL